MKYLWILVIVLCATMNVSAKSIEEHILVSYNLVLDQLKARGLEGPLADEVGRFALIRQLIEDGHNRDHSVSIVGMSLGGANERVLRDIGLIVGETNEEGLTLKHVTSNDGGRCYAVYGPRANVWSVVAITLLWDKYVNEGCAGSFRPEEIQAWNTSKEISRKMALNRATDEEIRAYREELAGLRKGVIEKANRMYSPTAAGAITKTVKDMKDVFDFVRF
jgi:hypothetical protein